MSIFSSTGGVRMYDEQSFYRAFEKDLYSARKSVIIESQFITLRRIEELLPAVTKLRRRGVSVTVNTRNPIEHEEEYEMQALIAIEKLQGQGMKVSEVLLSGHHGEIAKWRSANAKKAN